MDAYDGGSDDRRGPDTSASPAPPASPTPALPASPTPALPASPIPPASPPPTPPTATADASVALSPDEPKPVDITTLSPRHQIAVALALAVVAATVCVHLGMSFLHVAPANTITKQHGQAIDDWIYPEFEQNWKLFAPNPLQQNIAVQVRAEVRTGDGGTRTTGWYDLSAQDGRAIDGNLLPSHTQQNELRRAWDFFTATHGSDNRPMGMRGALSESYLRRIVVMRLDRAGVAGPGGSVERVQVRSRTTNVQPPEWTRERVSDKPTYRVLPWWSVSVGTDTADAEAEAEADTADAEADAAASTEGSAR